MNKIVEIMKNRVSGSSFIPGTYIGEVDSPRKEQASWGTASAPSERNYLVDMPAEQADHIDEDPAVVGVYPNPKISVPELEDREGGAHKDPDESVEGEVCPSGPIGTHEDVRDLLQVDELDYRDMRGQGVDIAIVDNGLNRHFMAGEGLEFDEERSWSADGRLMPGEYDVHHGCMTSWTAGIAAPNATFIDVPVLQHSDDQDGPFLSGAIKAYAYLRDNFNPTERPLVVNNSWGIMSLTDEILERYVKNRDHPFNRIVGSLASEGADIVFSAGNCGSFLCSSFFCPQTGDKTIWGANAHPKVTTVGACTVNGELISYSSRGPSYFDEGKAPNIVAYSHYKGSGVFDADSGTSTSGPVVAGLIGGIRAQRGVDDLKPREIKSFLEQSATLSEHDKNWGHGEIDTQQFMEYV